jgi:hypothetical protein
MTRSTRKTQSTEQHVSTCWFCVGKLCGCIVVVCCVGCLAAWCVAVLQLHAASTVAVGQNAGKGMYQYDQELQKDAKH